MGWEGLASPGFFVTIYEVKGGILEASIKKVIRESSFKTCLGGGGFI
jgi:hypothetical protein